MSIQARRALVEQTDLLKKELVDMIHLTRAHIEIAFDAFLSGDPNKSEGIRALDQKVDDFEEAISKHALQIIWREQPVASDLRLVTAILKMITDVERIGDHASDIAYMTKNISKKPDIKVVKFASELMSKLSSMYQLVIESFETMSESKAQQVIQLDESINTLFKQSLTEITEYLKDDSLEPNEAIYSLMILKYLEKIGDHATNIAEWIIFAMTGIHKNTSLY